MMLLPREFLPLSCLDLHSPQGSLPQSRLFASHIKILDLESRMGSAPKTLIARSESKRTTYAIERCDNSLYTICKLGDWTDLTQLAGHAAAVCHERVRPRKSLDEAADSTGTTALTTPQTHKEEKKKRVAIEAIQSLVRKRARSQSVSTVDTPVTTVPTSLPSSDASKRALGTEEVPSSTARAEAPSQQTADSIFDNIRHHYSDALYKSKVGSPWKDAESPSDSSR